MKRIYINVMPEETRIAIVDDNGQLQQILYERPHLERNVNHIYKGVVKNVLPGMEAAFLDIGIGQNVYLNLKSSKVKQKLKKLFVGQTMMVQVVKEAMLGKSPRVTNDISLAGRFVVLLPHAQGLHISKKITNQEKRARLVEMAEPYVLEGKGFILRTAAEMASLEDVQKDMAYLSQTWDQLQKRYGVAKNGSEIYGDADVWFRLVRDYVDDFVESIVVDHKEVYNRLVDLLGDCSNKVLYHEGVPSIFKVFHVEEQIDALLSNRVELPAGGSIQIDHTEALTVIDVNSGRYTGHVEGDVARRVNYEAATMIMRQLRLRDMGGIILCDFIDMPKEEQTNLLQYMAKLAKQDQIKTVVCGCTSLGLVEITRKRERQGVEHILFDTCSTCGGTGSVLSSESVYLQIIRRLRELSKEGKLRYDVQIEAHPEVAKHFTNSVLAALRDELKRVVEVRGVESMGWEAYSLLSLS